MVNKIVDGKIIFVSMNPAITTSEICCAHSSSYDTVSKVVSLEVLSSQYVHLCNYSLWLWNFEIIRRMY